MRAATLLLLASAAAFAQTADLDSNTLTVTAIRTASLPLDEATVSVSVAMDAATPLDDVVALLAGTGITAADLVQASPLEQYAQWGFTHSVPLSGLGTLLVSLDRIQSSGKAASFFFYVQSVHASAAAIAAHLCNNSTLLADAKTMAESLASAAGLHSGTVLNFSQPASATGSGAPYLSRGVSGSNMIVSVLTSPSYSLAPGTCALTVQFQLVR